MIAGTKIWPVLLLLFFTVLAAMASAPVFSKEYGDITMNRTAASMKKAGVNPVQFPHWFHRIRYKCKVCHEDIFVMEAGANEVNMDQIMEGKSCGACHNGKIAWEPLYCERCHTDGEKTSAQAPAAPPATTATPAKNSAGTSPNQSGSAPSTTPGAKKEAPKASATNNAAMPRVYRADDPDNPIYLGIGGRKAGRGDPNQPVSNAYQIGMGAHAAALQTTSVYKDKFGLINWSDMVDKGVIRPIESIMPGAEDAQQLDMDIIISPKSNFVKDVVFSHAQHSYWNNCTACHDKLFVMQKGENKMTMKGITQGKWCGTCHGKVAFPLADCARCHSRKKVAVGG